MTFPPNLQCRRGKPKPESGGRSLWSQSEGGVDVYGVAMTTQTQTALCDGVTNGAMSSRQVDILRSHLVGVCRLMQVDTLRSLLVSCRSTLFGVSSSHAGRLSIAARRYIKAFGWRKYLGILLPRPTVSSVPGSSHMISRRALETSGRLMRVADAAAGNGETGTLFGVCRRHFSSE